MAELKQFAREHGPIIIYYARCNKRSYYDAVKRAIKRNKLTQLRKLSLARLVERVERENIPLPEDGSGRRSNKKRLLSRR